MLSAGYPNHRDIAGTFTFFEVPTPAFADATDG